MSLPQMLFIDLFAGAGGVTSGIEHARCFDKKAAKVIACVNHDATAIASHKANHPDALHFTEDIRTLDLTALITIARHARKMNPTARLYLWASLECTNFSKAKGGLPRDADSRTLAEHLFRYMDAIDFDGIFIENVEEFMSWGPLDDNGKPISKERGVDYLKWVDNVKDYGFDFQHKILNAADFGAYTSRKRYFGIFVKTGEQIIFPTPTHSKKITHGLKPWKPVKDVLDFTDEGESIFTRKKPLSDRTMERIYAGLVKYVAKGDTSWLMKYNSMNGKTGKHIPPSIHEPCPTIAAQSRIGLVNTSFIAYYYGQITLSSTQDPCNTLRTKDTGQVVTPQFWIDRQFGQGGGKNSSIEEPIGTLPSVPKANLASAWILSPHFDNKGASIDKPMKTITANRKHHCLMFPQWGLNCGHSIEKPSPVLPARMDKMVPYIIQADETGIPIAIAVFDDDSEIIKKIKVFMAAYGIVDIKMRMLRIKELKLITGFDENYVLKGTQQEAKKHIGNAVPVLLAQAIIESFAQMLSSPITKAA